MKTHWMLTGLAVAGLGFSFIAKSQEPAADPLTAEDLAEPKPETDPFVSRELVKPKLIQVQVEYVELNHEPLTKLLFGSKPTDSNATKLREQVQEMVSRNEAKVLETLIATVRTGRKTTSESNQELIYPTAYEAASCSYGGDGKMSEQIYPPAPSSFQTRDLGSTLEVIEPSVNSEDRSVELTINPELVWHTGNVTWHEGKDPAGNSYRVQMPDIYTLRLHTELTCVSGQYNFVGVHSPRNDKGEADMSRKLMVFVKCDVLQVK